MKEKYCSLEFSSKLKEFGFAEQINSYSILNNDIEVNPDDVIISEKKTNHNSPVFHSLVSRPQYWQVAEWVQIHYGYLTLTLPSFIVESDWSEPAYKTVFKSFNKLYIDNVGIYKNKYESIEKSTLYLLETVAVNNSNKYF